MANTTHQRNDGLRGPDKQQGALQDQDSGQGVVRDKRGQDQPQDRERGRNVRPARRCNGTPHNRSRNRPDSRHAASSAVLFAPESAHVDPSDRR